MGTIVQFMTDQSVFEPEVTQAMSTAFDEACRALNLTDGAAREREAVAVRIIELTRRARPDTTVRARPARRRRNLIFYDYDSSSRSLKR
ncbi:MAG TPA: hypothetical protein VMR17_01575 [Xanthobacteraceae bacterium]|nr:hypothetical protein [Xanthobacteraceae bacterium]